MKKSISIFPTIQKRILVKVVVGAPDIEDPTQDSNSVICSALIDTGAMRTCISSRAANFLSLMPTGTMRIEAANGHTDLVNTHTINIDLGNEIRFVMINVPRLNMEDEDLIIGMDILCQGNYAVTNSEQGTVFMFQI